MQLAFGNWIVDMLDIHWRWARDQSINYANILWLDVRIAWCDVKIAFYS